MITPSFGLAATERVLPRLALDFTTASLDPRITFTRSGATATVINSSGVIVSAGQNVPRFDFNPTTLACRGLLIEEPRTNLLVNSLIDGTNLVTQNATVTAAHTLSFYGTGSVVLSGAHSATLSGSGNYPTRSTLTFTPTAGALTLTVSGDVKFAQLELGAFATSFIPTDATFKTPNANGCFDGVLMRCSDVSVIGGQIHNCRRSAIRSDFPASNAMSTVEMRHRVHGTTITNISQEGIQGIGLLLEAVGANVDISDVSITGFATTGIYVGAGVVADINGGVIDAGVKTTQSGIYFAGTGSSVNGTRIRNNKYGIHQINGNNKYRHVTFSGNDEDLSPFHIPRCHEWTYYPIGHFH